LPHQVEIVEHAGRERLLEAQADETRHDHFRPRRTVRMSPRMAMTKPKIQNLRMIASLHYQYTTRCGGLHAYLGGRIKSRSIGIGTAPFRT
jgi:hypothetical protein